MIDFLFTAWLSVNVSEKTRDIVARASNRVFVGLPLCMSFFSSQGLVLTSTRSGRNKGYLDLAVDFAISVMKDRAVINIFPKVLKP